jgi:hypothetical protein
MLIPQPAQVQSFQMKVFGCCLHHRLPTGKINAMTGAKISVGGRVVKKL